jgi:hypothetical protein
VSSYSARSLNDAVLGAYHLLKNDGKEVPVSRWQGVKTHGTFREIIDYSFRAPIPNSVDALLADVKPNMPWAEDHFRERVGGVPLNPGGQYKNWPYWTEEAETSMLRTGGEFSHTYMERMWPKQANPDDILPGSRWGIRFPYGDLYDLTSMLFEDPYTRQAYLPIWFPEDTGARHGERVPCSLGYHFMRREDQLHCWYDIRSCDYVHYLRDDIYFAARLTQWILANLLEAELRSDRKQRWVDVNPGNLYMNIHSLHVFGKDFGVEPS